MEGFCETVVLGGFEVCPRVCGLCDWCGGGVTRPVCLGKSVVVGLLW